MADSHINPQISPERLHRSNLPFFLPLMGESLSTQAVMHLHICMTVVGMVCGGVQLQVCVSDGWEGACALAGKWHGWAW